MLTKIVFLLFATSAFALNLRTTPEELKAYVKEIEEALMDNEHEAHNQIRSNLDQLLNFTEEANEHIFHELDDLAKPYWDEIAILEKEGPHVSACIELGNLVLYTLNATTVEPLIHEIASFLERGNEIIEESIASASRPLEELHIIEERANECSENRCADEIKDEATELFERAFDEITHAIQEAHDYVFVEVPEHLSKLNIDAERYVEAFTPILRDVKECARDL